MYVEMKIDSPTMMVRDMGDYDYDDKNRDTLSYSYMTLYASMLDICTFNVLDNFKML